MKISVLIVAHNEERYIRECIESLLNQTKKADEIVLLAHNSTDRTAAIGREYPISVYEYRGQYGGTYARIEGLNHVHGDIVLCIDGDTYADPNWTQVLSRLLQQGNVLAGTRVKFKGTIFSWLNNKLNAYRFSAEGSTAADRIWGASFGFWLRDKEAIRDIWRKSIELSREVGLRYNGDDYWLALFMNKVGKLAVTNKTSVTAYVKEANSWKAFIRGIEGTLSGIRIRSHFRQFEKS